MKHPPPTRLQHGSALVITLIFVVFLTIALVAAFVRVQVSGSILRSVADAQSAENLSREAVESVVASLRAGTTAPDAAWISSPGTITSIPANGDAPIAFPLHSGLAANYVDGTNLDAVLPQDAARTYISNQVGNQMPVRWIYLRQDGTRTLDPVYDSTNPLVGRYAFWTDDESTRINLNTAWTRESLNTDPPTAASRIPLNILATAAIDGEVLANAVESTRNTTGPFNSPGDILRTANANPSTLASLTENRFITTHYNHSSERTFFNEPKIVLTTRADRANGQPFLDFSNANIATTIRRLNDYLTRTDWPIAPGESYQGKYYEGNPERITQLSLNIIEYVRAKESAATATDLGVLIPIRGIMVGDNFQINQSSGLVNSYRGTTRGPKITELGIWRAEQLNPVGSRTFRMFIEVHLPANSGIASLDLTRFGRFQSLRNDSTSRVQVQASECWPDEILPAGGYRVISWLQNITLPANLAADWAAGTARLRPALFDPSAIYPNTNAVAFETVPLESLPSGTATTTVPVPVTTGPAGSTTITIPDAIATGIRSIEIDDPYLGGRAQSWVTNAAGNTFAQPNSIRSVGDPAQTTSPEQDMDAAGNITDIGIVLPAPAGSSENPTGRVESIGELGHVHTGIQVAASASAGTPWRTLRLQPRHPDAVASGTLPDWALLDIFTLPKTDSTDAILYPHPETTAGQININSSLSPFPNENRVEPLQALFTDLTNPPAGFDPVQTAANVADRQPAATPIAEGIFSANTNPPVFAHFGEIIEAAGVADEGEQSEAIVRQVIDHTTVRGNVFAIYSVGQSLVQSPNGTLNIRGEARDLTFVERTEEATGPRFTTVLHQPLSR